ncbi:glutathione S-transferase family protein [Microvirga terricola]|uniref:Glutathione S-transferase family protein n=1 Tax=Microvirga terricola TaxID=2719797 RepID=A0ABX0VFQ2_9HYPH|nr:glutathione S-transferase family protein [Microvirga terricola]NIX77206.1 glutathione S-transferase family protein [Microvirga terricola]
MSARFELHGTFLSGPTYKVGLALSLAGEPFDYVHVSLRDGEHKQSAYMSKQRYGQVPLLVDRSNGRQLCQSAAILEYLADKLGKFGGATLDERLEIREWLFWDFDRLAPPIYRTRAIKAGYRKGGPEILEMYATEAPLALGVLDKHLAGRDWMVGEGVSIADIDIFGVLTYAAEGGFDLSAYTNIAAWMKRMEALPGFGAQPGLLPQASREAA